LNQNNKERESLQKSNLYNHNPYSRIYIEKRALEYPIAKKVIEKYSKSTIIECNHYKDIFSRYSSDYREQKKSPKLILAIKDDNYIYKGSDLIQDQGEKNFFYTPIVLNCIYDCDYCFLQGMYTSAYTVIFVNIDDFFKAVDDRLSGLDSMFLSISYDTDLLAIESATGICKEWIEYASSKNNLKIEIRTKSANFDKLKDIDIPKNILFTWTLSPQLIIDKYEHKTPSLEKRVISLNSAISKGAIVSIVIDPILKIKEFEKVYKEFFEYIFTHIDSTKIDSAIIGTFRMSNNYFKSIKKTSNSDIYYDEYIIENKAISYNKELENRYISFVSNILKDNKIEKIFTT
jgi:spore photoproduct lyase